MGVTTATKHLKQEPCFKFSSFPLRVQPRLSYSQQSRESLTFNVQFLLVVRPRPEMCISLISFKQRIREMERGDVFSIDRKIVGDLSTELFKVELMTAYKDGHIFLVTRFSKHKRIKLDRAYKRRVFHTRALSHILQNHMLCLNENLPRL